MSLRRACLTIVAVLIIFGPALMQTQAVVERQLELVSGNLLFQDQFFATAPTQTLFHSQAATGTDSEAFSFSPVPGGGIALSQTSSASTIATDTGFFFAFSSFKRFNCPTGEGYMHTSIDDPLVSRTPVFSSLIFPSMITKDRITGIAGSASVDTPVTRESVPENITVIEPLIKKQISSGQVGVPDTSNIMAVTPTPTPPQPTAKPTPAFGVTTAGQELPTPTLMPTPAPSPRPPYAVLPAANSLLTKPMSHQANKPFTSIIDPDYNPRTACRDDIRNISGWDRLTTNVIGRSAIDSTYLNRTSYPSYMNPWNAIRLANQFDVMAETRNMTHAGSYLQQRMWAL